MNREQEKTVLIPIRVHNGKVQYLYGGALPELKENAIGELSVPREAVLDHRKRDILEHEELREFLPKDTVLLAQVSPKSDNPPAENVRSFIKRVDKLNGVFVELHLRSDLHIRLRGTKLGALEECHCTVPGIDRDELNSVNQAYTAITEVFEPHRRSRGGNVFLMLFAKDASGNFHPLEVFRKRIQAQYEEELKLLNQWWWFNCTDLFASNPEWALLAWKSTTQFTIRCFRNLNTIYADFYFSEQREAVQWLNENGYEEYQPEKHKQFKPPKIMNNSE